MGLVLTDKETGMIRWAEIRDRVWKEEDERIAREQAMVERERILSEKVRVAEEQLRNAEEQARNAEEQARAAEEQARTAKEQTRTSTEKAFARLCERRLRRPLSTPERARLAAQMDALGLEMLAERIADLNDDALAAWLASNE